MRKHVIERENRKKCIIDNRKGKVMCMGKQSKKSLGGKLIVTLAMILAMTGFMHTATNVNAATTKTLTEQQVINTANAKVGQAYPNGYCLKFVSDFWNSFGATRSSACCAHTYANTHVQSTNINTIPIGADVYFQNTASPCSSCKNRAGHVGIYVGGGYFVHATGGKIQKSTISSWSKNWRGWGYHSNIKIAQVSNNGGNANAQAVAVAKPSINSVKINGIDCASIGFSFSASNATLVKIHIESTLTGETKEISYTQGLSKISYNFSRRDMPTGGNQYRIYLYAYSSSGSKYVNETVHKMMYGGTANCVTFPNTLSNSQLKSLIFNYKFYADLYPDVKKAYGYNEEALWKHFLKWGLKEGRCTVTFAPKFYLKNNSDVAKAYNNSLTGGFFHYTTWGYKEARNTSPVFSAKWYLDNNKDISNAYGKTNYLQAAIHMNKYGINEARNSSLYYWGSWYKANNGDLKRLNYSSYNLLLHYYNWGINEKRAANTSRKIPVIQ